MREPLRDRIRHLLDTAKAGLAHRARRVFPRAATAAARGFADRIVSDAILFNETACAPEREARRADFLATKLREFGYPDPGIDERGGLTVAVPGSGGRDEAILLFADPSFPVDAGTDCIVSLRTDRAVGRGMAEDSVGVAALLVLAEHFAGVQARPARDVVLHFLPCTQEREEERALTRFIGGCGRSLAHAVHLRSIVLGRIEERPEGACRLRVRVRTGEPDAAPAPGAASAITLLATIASRLGGIRWDNEGNTFLSVSRLEAGAGFGWHASEGVLELEIMSTDAAALEVARRAVEATIQTAAAESRLEVHVEDAGSFPPARAEVNAGLTEALRRVYARLRIRPVPVSVPDHSAVISALGIPAVSLGITTGRKTLTEEWVDIAPIETGFRQVLALLEETAPRGAAEGSGG